MLMQWLSSAWHRTFFVAALVLVLVSAVPGQAHALSASTLVSLTNTQRTNNGLAPLTYDSRLAASAAAKAQHMVTYGYWAHTAPDGTTPWTFVRNAGYPYVVVGENLAKGFSADSSVISAWMGSSSHRANILNAKFRHIGIAVTSGVIAGKQTTVIVAHYGATSSAPAPAPAPKPAATKPAARTTPTKQPAPKAAPKPVKPSVKSAPATPASKPSAPQQPVVVSEVPKPKTPVKQPYELLLDRLVAIIDVSNGDATKLALR